jgi:hypothetical protein
MSLIPLIMNIAEVEIGLEITMIAIIAPTLNVKA